jgi:hypothetical protein
MTLFRCFNSVEISTDYFSDTPASAKLAILAWHSSAEHTTARQLSESAPWRHDQAIFPICGGKVTWSAPELS